MSAEDLIPLNERTKEEQKKITTAGGKASGEARRAKRTLREIVRMVLDEEITAPSGEKVTRRAAIAKTHVNKAIKGDVKSAKLVADWSGEAPTKQEITGEDGQPLLVTFAEIDARFKAVNEHKDD